jgi:two-component system chemotaxis response regulator CheY
MSPKKNIMVVEDNPLTTTVITAALKKMDVFVVHSFANGLDAWKTLTSKSGEKFDLIISDWEMPGMGGLELLQKARANAKTKALPFIILTGKASLSELEEARTAGVTACLFKPINADRLQREISAIMEKVDPSFQWVAS